MEDEELDATLPAKDEQPTVLDEALVQWQTASGQPKPLRPVKSRNLVTKMFHEMVNNQTQAQSIWDEYLRLALHARSEELRAKMLIDLLDRAGLPRSAEHNSATAVAQVINIIRGSPELGV